MKSSLSELRQARPLLGTIVEVVVDGMPERAARTAIREAFAAVEDVQRRMSFHDPESTLSQLNRRGAYEPVQVDELTFAVLETAAMVHRVSGGIFDVTIAPRLQALGFLPGDSAGMPTRHRSPYSFADVEFLPDRWIRFSHPDVRLDLGGIAKGFAVDQAVAALRNAGVPRALVNAGGDLRAFGSEAFPVAIRHPEEPGASLGVLALSNAALATSAHYFADRFVPHTEFGPIIDPRSGCQATRVRSATVRAESAILADALTKVVMLSAEASLPILEFFNADAIIVATDRTAICSPDLHAAFELSA